MTEQESSQESSGFEGFASQALRLTRKGSFEQLLAQHLIQSVSMDSEQGSAGSRGPFHGSQRQAGLGL
jgi:hypothetical protein